METPGKIDLETCKVNVLLQFFSKFPKPIENTKLESALLPCEHKKHTPEQTFHNISLSSASFSSNSGGPTITKGGSRKSQGHIDPSKLVNSAAIAACEEEDANLSMNEINDLSNMKLKLGQQFDVKADKSVQAGKLFCQNSHLALRFVKQ